MIYTLEVFFFFSSDSSFILPTPVELLLHARHMYQYYFSNVTVDREKNASSILYNTLSIIISLIDKWVYSSFNSQEYNSLKFSSIFIFFFL